MKISTKGRYGLRAMAEIASANGERLAIKTIAARQDISEAYLEQIIASLKRSGLVKSLRGSSGGYVLAKPMEEIKVGDVLRSLEGPLSVADCTDARCGVCQTCVAKGVWEKLQNSIDAVIDGVTLKDLISPDKESVYENLP
jgi:Rrf2 family protein